MTRARSFVLGFLSCLFLLGCAGFAYRNYGLEGVNYVDGKLLAKEPKDDLPFSACKPDEVQNPDGTVTLSRKCIVMFIPEFIAFKKDYEDLKTRLVACEKNCQ